MNQKEIKKILEKELELDMLNVTLTLTIPVSLYVKLTKLKNECEFNINEKLEMSEFIEAFLKNEVNQQ